MGVEREAVQIAVGQLTGFLYPSAAERSAAYELLVELTTRTATVSMATSEGSIREALDSLHDLFAITRGILRAHGVEAAKGSGGNLSLAVVAVRVLNHVIRPVTGKWHPRLADHEARRVIEAPTVSPIEWERDWVLAARCRAELGVMRASVRAYVDTLGRIAGAPGLADATVARPTSRIFPASVATNPTPRLPMPRQRMVRWLRLAEMWRIGPATLAAKRELSRLVGDTDWDGTPTARFRVAPDEEFWFDYSSDMGDAFDGTAPVAWLIGRRSISVPPDRSEEMATLPALLPRARLLVFGGDEVYPFAASGVYEAQTELPFQMAWEQGKDDQVDAKAPTLVAIPGNHDWLGGISHFRAMFASGRRFAGHWKTVQKHTFWHVQLPQGWWLWGIDTGLSDEMSSAQQAYFEKAAERLSIGARVILCSPVPLWQLRQKDPRAYVRLRNPLDKLIQERQATMPLCLSGDSHFFAHFERADADPMTAQRGEDHITAGGGGAFLHPTHGIPERIPLEGGNPEFNLTSRWPLPSESRGLAPGVRNLRDRQYWMIMAVLGAVHLAFASLVARRWSPLPWAPEPRAGRTPVKEALLWAVSSPWALLLLAVVAASGVLMVKASSREPGLTAAARRYGLLVGVGVAASLVALTAARHVIEREAPALGPGALVAAIVGGVLSTALLFGLLGWVNVQIKAGDNLTFSAAHLTRYKHFIRFRIHANGDLTAYVIGIDPVGQGWYEAMHDKASVPPFDPAGIPRIHYVWGRTYPKFVPQPMRIAMSISQADDRQANKSTYRFFEELCAALINAGHTLAYCGRKDQLNELYLKQLRAAERNRHQDVPGDRDRHLVNYMTRGMWKEAGFPENDLLHQDGQMSHVLVPREPQGREVKATAFIRDLTVLRERMNKEIQVRIVVGGDERPGARGSRRAPGVLEEAWLAVRGTPPVPLLVAGGFGGVGGRLAAKLLGELDQADLEDWAGHFTDREQFMEMIGAFDSLNVLDNPLSASQNRELLTTTDAHTAQRLIEHAIARIAAVQGS